MLEHLTSGVHTADASQRFAGLEIGARMTVLELSQGLLIHSPIAMDPSEVEHVGNPRWVLAPNKLQ